MKTILGSMRGLLFGLIACLTGEALAQDCSPYTFVIQPYQEPPYYDPTNIDVLMYVGLAAWPKASVETYGTEPLNDGIGWATYYRFSIFRVGDVSESVSVSYFTVNLTALAGADYAAASGTLTFAPNEVQKIVSVRILWDNLVEGAETFQFVLSDTGTQPPVTNAIGVIKDSCRGITSECPAQLH